ncbi:ABC transporter substrate-binding protein [Chachezhania sediminis]|uniref:ABC transporter substrate-binding protein n=1 Tax=Chachezhania sediminis TaxID=2599291 RepID=UPI00131E6A3F|nr:extracellular solute-binding protein [Chachezhania sediminis]
MTDTRMFPAAVGLALLSASVTLPVPALAQFGDDCVLHVLGTAKNSPEEEAGWDKVAANFAKAYGCDVEMRWTGQWNEMPQNLAAARLAGEAVDVVYNTGTINASLAASGILMDITPVVEPFAARFAGGSLGQYTLGDRVWAVPVSDSSTAAFVYNKTMFDELGLTPPETFDELVAVGQAVADGKPGVQPMVQRGQDVGYWPMWFMETFAQTTGNKSIEAVSAALSGDGSFDTPEVAQALEALKGFVDGGLLNISTLNVGRDAMRATFLQGRAAMLYGGTWELGAVRRADPDFEIGVFEFPLVTDAAGVVSQHGGGADVAWSIPSFIAPDMIPVAAQFLEFISRPDQAELLLAPLNPLIPSVVGVAPGDEPLAPQLIEDFAPHTISYLDWIWPTELNDVIAQAIPAVMFDQMTAEEAAAEIQANLERIRVESDYAFDWWTTWSEDELAAVTIQDVPEIEVK